MPSNARGCVVPTRSTKSFSGQMLTIYKSRPTTHIYSHHPIPSTLCNLNGSGKSKSFLDPFKPEKKEDLQTFAAKLEKKNVKVTLFDSNEAKVKKHAK